MRPYKIQVMNRDIPIYYIMDMEPGTLGFYEDGAIYIDAEIEDSPKLQRIILHEITHAIFDFTGYNQLMEENVEDAICVVLEFLSDIYCLKDNINFTKECNNENQKDSQEGKKNDQENKKEAG